MDDDLEASRTTRPATIIFTIRTTRGINAEELADDLEKWLERRVYSEDALTWEVDIRNAE